MNKKRFLSIVMAVLMVISLLPSLVFAAAAPAGEMEGTLAIKGAAEVGSTLSADFTKAKPKGLTGEYVSFQWSRKAGEELTEVGLEEKYKVTEEDFGSKIVLTVTGIKDNGVTGSLSASTEEIGEASGDIPGQNTDEPNTDEPNTDEPNTDEPNTDEPNLDEPNTDEPNTDGPNTDEPNTDSQPEETDEPLVYTAQAGTQDGSGVLDFGILDYGYEEAPEKQYVTIANTGTGELSFEEMSPDYFMVQDIEEPLQPGEEVTVWVQPRTGLEPGTYMDLISYTGSQGGEASFQATVTVEGPEQKPIQEPSGDDPEMEPLDDPKIVTGPGPADVNGAGTENKDPENNDPENNDPAAVASALTVDPAALSFAAVTEGYTQVTEKQTVTVTNKGDSTVTLVQPQPQYFDVLPAAAEGTQADGVGLAKDQSAVYTVQPKAGLAKGQYSEEITFGISEDTEVKAKVTAELEVKAKEENLIKADPSGVKFDTVKEDYTELPAAQTVTLTNESAGKLTVAQPESKDFTVGILSAAALEAGGSATFTLQPKAGLKAGEYKEIINIMPDTTARTEETALEETEPKPLASVTVEFKVDKADKVYKLTVSPESLDFGSKEAGYKESPAAQTVTVTNEGEADAELGQPVSDYFEIGALSAAVLKPGEKAVFTVRPMTGLEESDYLEVIDIPNDGEAQILVDAYFSVTDKSIKLTAIQKVGEITGLKNGVEKSAQGLKLPSTVIIQTTNGKMKANVKWDVKGSSYDPKSTDKQTFTVKGTVTLPKGVKNPEEISLITSVKVTVNGYTPKVPDASENRITGIGSDEGYTTESKITFTAVGAGMDNGSPRKGDVRYVPLNWKVLETRGWDSAPYTATFRMGQSGNYTLTVTFNQQKFDGSNWVNTGTADTKYVNFTVSQPKTVTNQNQNQNLTPAVKKSDVNKRNAVKTGDTTNVAPFIIILVAAAACVVGVVVYRRKKK